MNAARERTAGGRVCFGLLVVLMLALVGCARREQDRVVPDAVGMPTKTPEPMPTVDPQADASELLQQNLALLPDDWKIVVNDEVTVLVPDVRNSTAMWIGSAIFYHVPSASEVALNWEWAVTWERYNSEDGRAQIEAAMADEAVMRQVEARVRAFQQPPGWFERVRAWISQRTGR